MCEMISSAEIGELVKALAAAQLEYASVHKDSENPFYSSRYADLPTVIRATQPALAKNGLVVTQWPIVDNNLHAAGVISELAHSSGQWKRIGIMLPAEGQTKGGGVKYDAQTVGTAITYARRYTYQAIVGVAAEVDDDANSISEASGSREAAREVATKKLKEKAAGDESIVLTPWKEGRIALSGKGVAIIRAALSEIEKRDLGIMLEPRENVIHMPAAKGFDLVDACKKHDVPTIWMDSQTQHGTNGGAAKPSQAASPGKIIQATARRNGQRKDKNGKLVEWALLEVVWDGEKHVCWDSKLWEHIEKSKGAPAVFLTTPSFDGKRSPTIEDISSIGNVTFTNGTPDLQQAER